MFFKPRIFISSTLKENSRVRELIKKHFVHCGAEPLLYEDNLTPSSTKFIYRTYIKEADFIIFIIKDEYGAKTESGLSGTHEELYIALENNIPNHVYIKLNARGPSKEMEDFVKKKNISYYYYKNDTQLLNRIKETTFTITKETTLRSIAKNNFDKKISATVAIKYDYDVALRFMRTIDGILQHSKIHDLVSTSLFLELENLFDDISNQDWIFIDKKLQEILISLNNIWRTYLDRYPIEYTQDREKGKINIFTLGEVTIFHASKSRFSKTDFHKIVADFFSEYDVFNAYVKNMKLENDKLNFQT